MKRQSRFDYYSQLFAIIAIPLCIAFVFYWDSTHSQANITSRSYIILSLIELLMIFLFSKSVRNLKFLDYSFNTGSLKESLVNVKSHFKAYSKKAYWVGVISFWFILSFIVIDILIRIEGISQLNFSTTGSHLFESYFAIFVVLLMVAVPFIIKLELRRYARALRDIDQTLDEFTEEGE